MKISFILILVSSLFTFSHSYAQSMKPGFWHVKESFKINGIALPSHEGNECISSEEAKDVKASLVESLQKKDCTLTNWTVNGENLQAGLNCKNNDFTAKGTLTGHFTKKSYTLKGRAKGKIKDTIPAKADVEMQGQWISACPKQTGTT